MSLSRSPRTTLSGLEATDLISLKAELNSYGTEVLDRGHAVAFPGPGVQKQAIFGSVCHDVADNAVVTEISGETPEIQVIEIKPVMDLCAAARGIQPPHVVVFCRIAFLYH